MTEYDYFSGDIKRLWQDQISGKIDFDYGDFLGALTDLQSDPDWKEAFAAIEKQTGMPEFLERLQQHFDLCRSPANPDGSVYAYQHPTRTNQIESAKDQQAMVELAKRHLRTAAVAVEKTYADDDDDAVKLLQNMEVSWTEDWSLISDDIEEFDEHGLAMYVYEGMSGIEDGCEKKDLPKIMSYLREASYGLAASYDLQHYLMQGFYTYEYDVDALYELEWVNGCDFRFNGDNCYVFDLAKYKAHKDAQKS